MGVSIDQFWETSSNGKAMLVAVAGNGHVEVVRDVCDWLVVMYRKDTVAGAVQNGATLEQAKIVADNAVTGLQSAVDSINDRNVVGTVRSIVDTVFQRHYNAGKPTYDRAMAQLANELRKRVK